MTYWPVSDRWAEALASKPFTPYVTVDIYAGRLATQPLNSSPLQVTTGSTSWDTTSAVRRSMSSVTFVSEPGLPLVPNAAGDLLYPNGIEVVVSKGFVYPDGTTETVPQGRLLVEDAVVVDASSGSSNNLTIALDGSDRMAEVQRYEFTQPGTTVPSTTTTSSLSSSGALTIPVATALTATAPFIVTVDEEAMYVTSVDPSTGNLSVPSTGRGYQGTTAASHSTGAPVTTTADVTITALLLGQLPGCPVNVQSLGYVLAPATWSVGDDVSQFIATQAYNAGAEVFFDRLGTFTVQPIPNPATISPSVSYVEGPGTIMTQLQRTLSNKGVPNWIIVISQGSNIPTPLRADWIDTNPNSPTYFYGTYPTTTQTYTTALATTQAQVQAMANALGQANLGAFDGLQITTLGDPAFGDGDVALVTRAASRFANSPYVFQQGQLSLDTSNNSTLTGFRVVNAPPVVT